MGKSANKKAKIKEVKFTIRKSIFKRILEQNLKHIGNFKEDYSILSGLKMEVAGNMVTFVSTNTETLLESTHTLDEMATGNVDVVLQGLYLNKMKLCKDYKADKKTLGFLDVLDFTVKEDLTIITDVRNGIDYKVPYFVGQYPEYKKLILTIKDNEDYQTIEVNANMLASLSGINGARNYPVRLGIKNSNSAIVVESANDDNDLNFRALVMPCIIRN